MAQTKKTAKPAAKNTGLGPTNRDVVEIASGSKKSIPIRLVGKDYMMKPPKAYIAMKLAVTAQQAGNDVIKVMEALEEWVGKAFSAKDKDAIMARLDDADDDLDITHLMTLLMRSVEYQTAGLPSS